MKKTFLTVGIIGIAILSTSPFNMVSNDYMEQPSEGGHYALVKVEDIVPHHGRIEDINDIDKQIMEYTEIIYDLKSMSKQDTNTLFDSEKFIGIMQSHRRSNDGMGQLYCGMYNEIQALSTERSHESLRQDAFEHIPLKLAEKERELNKINSAQLQAKENELLSQLEEYQEHVWQELQPDIFKINLRLDFLDLSEEDKNNLIKELDDQKEEVADMIDEKKEKITVQLLEYEAMLEADKLKALKEYEGQLLDEAELKLQNNRVAFDQEYIGVFDPQESLNVIEGNELISVFYYDINNKEFLKLRSNGYDNANMIKGLEEEIEYLIYEKDRIIKAIEEEIKHIALWHGHEASIKVVFSPLELEKNQYTDITADIIEMIKG